MPVYSYKSSKNKTRYYYKFDYRCKKYLKRGFATKKDALESESVLKQQLINDSKMISINSYYNITWYQLIDSFLSWFKLNFKETTYKDRLVRINSHIKPYLPNVPINNLTFNDFNNFKKIINSKPILCITKNKYISLVRSIFDFAKNKLDVEVKHGLYIDTFKDYDIKKIGIKKKALYYDEFFNVYKNCNDNYYKLLMLMIFCFGFRIGEILGLKVNSIDFQYKYLELYNAVSVKTLKKGTKVISPKSSSSHRIYRLPTSICLLLKQHIDQYKLKDEQFLFFRYNSKYSNKNIANHENQVRRQLKHYFGEDFFPHMLRHTNISILNDKGFSINDIKKFVGHSNIETTLAYIESTQDKENVSEYMINSLIDSLNN